MFYIVEKFHCLKFPVKDFEKSRTIFNLILKQIHATDASVTAFPPDLCTLREEERQEKK